MDDGSPEFVPGLELAEGFFSEAVEPILKARFPDLTCSAALIGSGSEVLGFDTEMSADHHWGPRVMLFLRSEDLAARKDEVHQTLAEELPLEYRGFSTHFTEPDPEDGGTQLRQTIASGPVNHRVEMHTLAGYFSAYLGLRIDREPSPADWLSLPHQKLRSIAAGGIFRDDLGLGRIRSMLAWYPRDVWLYVLASGWARIGQEEHLVGRAGSVGDEIGSTLIAARLVRDVMRLAFLMERQYPPYAKWFGTAFAGLAAARELTPPLAGALRARTWSEREPHLCAAYESLARRHAELGITEPVPGEVAPFWGRPFQVIHGDRFARALQSCIRDPRVRAIARRGLVGSVDLLSDSTDLLSKVSLRKTLTRLWAP